MKFGQAIDSVLFKNYFNLEGKATRSEYWWFMLFFIIFTLFYLHGRAYRQIGKLFRLSASIGLASYRQHSQHTDLTTYKPQSQAISCLFWAYLSLSLNKKMDKEREICRYVIDISRPVRDPAGNTIIFSEIVWHFDTMIQNLCETWSGPKSMT